MNKLSVIVAGAALSAVAVGGPATVSAAVSAQHAGTAQHQVAPSRGATPTKARISALFDRWESAVETGDPEKVTALYAKDAVLLPTLSARIRTNHDEIADYFEGFLARNPTGTRLRSIVKVLDGRTAIDTGIYRFTFHNADGSVASSADARYTYVYEKRDGKWWIINHHSSLLPTGD